MNARRYTFCTEQGFEAVIFDWDGVVADSAADYYRAYELTLAPRGIVTTAREVYLREGMTTEQVMTALYAARGLLLSEQQARDLARERREIYSRIARNQFFPGIWEMIGDLHQLGFKVALVTGSTRGTLKLALSADREGVFSAIVTGDSVVHPKPDPEPFLIASRDVQVAPDRCLVVENAPFGIESAHRAGCRVGAVCTTLEATDLQEADWVLPDHVALRRLLDP
jgi:beta-phosphoglucomutase